MTDPVIKPVVCSECQQRNGRHLMSCKNYDAAKGMREKTPTDAVVLRK